MFNWLKPALTVAARALLPVGRSLVSTGLSALGKVHPVAQLLQSPINQMVNKGFDYLDKQVEEEKQELKPQDEVRQQAQENDEDQDIKPQKKRKIRQYELQNQ